MTIPRQMIRAVEEGGDTTRPTLPKILNLDDADSLIDVLDALALDPFVTGRQPYGRTVSLERVRPTASLLPDGARVQRDVTLGDGRRAVFATGTGWTLLAQWSRTTDANLTVTAVSGELAQWVLDEATRDATDPPPPDDSDKVTLGFWSLTPNGAHRRTRVITAPEWHAIRGNYATGVAAAVGRLMDAEAAAWLGRSAGIGPDGATLAELYALRDGIAPSGPPSQARTGLYL
ncbi:MAG: DUF5925 domain-containing protein [Micromonosporaceae bacterium]